MVVLLVNLEMLGEVVDSLCENSDLKCLKKVRKSGRVAHNLECEISPEVYDRMEAELTADEGTDA